MKIYVWSSSLLTVITMAIAVGSFSPALAQRGDIPKSGADTDIPTGNIRDLDGLEERAVDDWFPQNGISGGQSPSILEINQQSPPSSVVNPQIIGGQDDEWIKNTSGDPKQTGAGIPLGKF